MGWDVQFLAYNIPVGWNLGGLICYVTILAATLSFHTYGTNKSAEHLPLAVNEVSSELDSVSYVHASKALISIGVYEY